MLRRVVWFALLGACSGTVSPADGPVDEPDLVADATFGANGVTQISWPGAYVKAITPRSSGGFLALVERGADRELTIIAIDDDGTIDASFGSAGRVGLQGRLEFATRVHPTPGGTWTLIGGCGAMSGSCVLRFLADGSPDPAFGEEGILAFATVGNARGTIDHEERIVWAADNMIGRFDASGQPDPTFGDGGVASSTFDAGSIAVQQSGRLVLTAGGAWTSFDLHGMTDTGEVDTEFGGPGSAGGAIGSLWVPPMVGPGDELFAAGRARLGGVMIVKYTEDGRADSTFGELGRVVIPDGETARGIALLDDGRIIVVSGIGIRGVILTLDAGGDWIDSVSTPQVNWTAVTRDGSGRVLVGGSIITMPDYSAGVTFARYLPQ